jgi:hypothetical protein
VPVVDVLAAGGADDEGLPAHRGRELRPTGLWPSRLGEVGESAAVVRWQVGAGEGGTQAA